MTVVADTGVRTKTIVVGIVADRWAGAIAYALKMSLTEAARISVVRVSELAPSARTALALPVSVRDVCGDPLEALIREGQGADALVVESPRDVIASLGDPVIGPLRLQTTTLLVEVDDDGEIVRASGAGGWAYAAQPDLRPAMPPVGASSDRIICVGVDSSAASTAAVHWAASTAARDGSTVRLVGVHAEVGAAGGRQGTRQDAWAALTAAQLVVGGSSEVLAVGGEPAHCLLDASVGASMLVLGRHGTDGLIHSALGSVGDTCARLAGCPVVIVPQGLPGS